MSDSPVELGHLSVPIHFHSKEPRHRNREPTTCGLPWPRGAVRSHLQLRLIGPSGDTEPLQTRVLDRWSDGSLRWCLVEFSATSDGAGEYRIEVVDSEIAALTEVEVCLPNRTLSSEGIQCGALKISSAAPTTSAFLSVRNGALSPVELTVTIAVDRKPARSLSNCRTTLLESGPIRTRLGFTSPHLDGLQLFGHIDFFASTPVARMQLTVRNPQPAGHPGGNWDLGNSGSIDIRSLTVSIRLPAADGQAAIRCSPEPGQSLQESSGLVELYQDSSGGENWKHHNHLNRNRVVPHQFRGYRLKTSDGVREGLRATPIVQVERSGQSIAAGMTHFWENFPKSLEADANGISLHLFPKQSSNVHELQGGEQKTHVFHLAFGDDLVTGEALAWCRSPLLAHADPKWYAASGAIPYLNPTIDDSNTAYTRLFNQAIEGPDNFFTKRETIDEFGWRNFGDVYADHEAVYHQGPKVLVSHYNNQFDVVRGCAIQFLRSADPRWWELLLPAADHTCDVDLYHTDGDKQAYNGGLFPFTFHYSDADTSSHRGYPRSLHSAKRLTFGRDFEGLGATGEALRRATVRGLGGGPGASHNYTQGLMLAYFLTGNPVYRETAIGLADFVIQMDAPRPIFRCLSGEYTGEATASSSDYHGPGRAAGNSILALLVGNRLTGRREHLEKAEQIIRRVSHPSQNLEALDLLNAELRWFYTMYLQALGEYLDHKDELNEHDQMYIYARLTLLHFARWMAANERPYLDRADTLQYPTETWAAQDMRKVEVFHFAARHAEGDEQARFLERADWFFQYVERTLSGFATKSLCRPTNLTMNFGWSRAWWKIGSHASPHPTPIQQSELLGEWTMFVSQKAKVLKRAKLLFISGIIVGVTAALGLSLLLLI